MAVENPSLLTRLRQVWPPQNWGDVTVLAAVSGGADSIALLYALLQLRDQYDGAGRIIAAHFHHGLRGAEAEADMEFVTARCRQWGCPCEVGRATTDAVTDTGPPGQAVSPSDEARARRLRYEFLQQTALRRGARYVAVAHTADDQAETVLHRIVRGTGLSGLAGIPMFRPLHGDVTLVRPFLQIRKNEIRAWLAEQGCPHREDSSNRDRRYTRNRIRHELLPLLAADYNPQIVDSLLRLGAVADDARRCFDRLAEDWLERCVALPSSGENPRRIVVDCLRLRQADPLVIREVFSAIWRREKWPQQSMGFPQWEKLRQLILVGGDRKATLPGAILAERVGEKLRLHQGDIRREA